MLVWVATGGKVQPILCLTKPEVHLNIQPILPGINISNIKIRSSLDHLIFKMGIPILVRWHIHIETVPVVGKTEIITIANTNRKRVIMAAGELDSLY